MSQYASQKRWREANREKCRSMRRMNYQEHREKEIENNMARVRQMVDAIATMANQEEELAHMAEILFRGLKDEKNKPR